MKKIDLSTAPTRIGTSYPSPFDAPCRERTRLRLGVAAGLTQFGVNKLILRKGQWSSQRHWHHRNDEFVMVLEGEVVLVTDAGEETLRPGDCAGFKAGDPDGHHFQNRSETDAVLLEIGSCFDDDIAEYSDIDLRALPEGYVHKDGTPYNTPPVQTPKAPPKPRG
ncbi:MAG: cupin domain-containing protein [Polyangiaceae bacterium]|nr:cupin domain-containing protein [Polyangiaceae bacterium]